MAKKISADEKLLLEIQAGQIYDHARRDEKREENMGNLEGIASFLKDLIFRGR